ncbi:TonB-dependent receptor [Novosphingobium resinovorum]|uniref:TonB-dependent receptor n=1 Tax=Novosphingobium resinovorum TaxID=158500 RepID=A0A031JSJ9_9SPHN|nr:TonB-dependent receptor [Novosphingobium resinovorum]EZP79322.1 TonB-dependent receptor [Novosphingobium resinovorum]
MRRYTLYGCSLFALVAAGTTQAQAQTTSAPQGAPSAAEAPKPTNPSGQDSLPGEIIVTANKRAQSLNDVPLSVSVASGDQLKARNITDVGDLAKVVPGFTYTESAFATPVYTLRGVGFYDTSIAAKPSVSVYVDEVPLPFSIITRGATLDLQRVEVLKGPQGTLFGQNSTGGAINYIAAKPTDTFEAGATVGYERFNRFTAEGYISAPISDTLGVRVAARTDQGGAWQRSLTRPDDTIGDKRFTTGRVLLDFKPTSTLKFELNLNGYIDKSDESVAQYIALTPLANPARAGALDAAPRALDSARDADWTPDPRPRRDHSFWQASFRGDWEFAPDISLTSISAYSRYKHNQRIDPDGVALNDYFYHTTGRINSFSQELRIGGKVGPDFNFIVGGNYSDERTRQRDENSFLDATSAYQFTDTFAALGVTGFPPFFGFVDQDKQDFTSKAVFANADYTLGNFILHGGVRYTDAKTKFQGCTLDDGGGTLALGYQTVLNSIRVPAGLAPITIAPGSCVSTDIPTLTPGLRTATLKENNVSWRAGVDYKPSRDVLFYLSVSRGYKSGSFPLLAASDNAQFDPVTQESVTAYEAGFKLSVLDRTAQINGAVFYYDYRDKQLKGRSISNPDIFGPLERLFNVPKSEIKGAEIQLDLRPTPGFNVSIGATYIDSKVRGSFVNIDSYGTTRDFAGSAFPYTPKYQVVMDGQYEWALSDRLGAFFGASLTFQSDTIGALGPQTSYPYPELNSLKGLTILSYELLGLRTGLETEDKKYRLSLYVNNLTNSYYFTNATRITDTTVRYAGMPRTYGVTLSAKY